AVDDGADLVDRQPSGRAASAGPEHVVFGGLQAIARLHNKRALGEGTGGRSGRARLERLPDAGQVRAGFEEREPQTVEEDGARRPEWFREIDPASGSRRSQHRGELREVAIYAGHAHSADDFAAP